MEQLEVTGALPDFDNLDVDLDNSGGFELGSGDFAALLGADDNDKFVMNDSDIDNLMNEGMAEGGANAYSDEIDHLKIMPIAEIDQADVILGLEPAKERQQDYEPKPMETQRAPQWNQQVVQQPDPLLGNLRYETMPQSSDSIQMIVDQGIQQGANNGMLPPMGQNRANVADLQDEKQKLMERLREINMREERTSNGFQQQQQQQMMMRPNNGFVLQRNEQLPQSGSQSSNMFLREQTPFSAPAPVASVGGLGGGGETPLQSFLRAGRKSQNPGGQPPRPAGSLLSQNIAGAPKAASIFSHLPMDLEAIASQSELQASNSFLQQQNEPKTHLFASMDRSSVSQEMVRKLSARSLSRQNSGRKASGNIGNAAWGMDPSRKSGFRTSGILSKHASESHLVRKGGLVSKSSKGSLSRENALYSMMKRNSSKNLIRRDDSQGSLLPTKRRGGSKHKLSLSRSVPALMANNGGSMPQGSKNAMW